MIDVSCIIINYNTAQFTIDCIQSIVNTHDEKFNYEIIVVDNNSSSKDFALLKKGIDEMDHSQIRLVPSSQNTGFGGGNMLGVHHASASKYYAFINNDTLQKSKNCLGELKQFMDTHSDVAVCSPQMLDEHDNFRVTIDHFSSLQREIFKRALLEFLFPKTYLNRKKRYDKPTAVHYVQGSFMFIDTKEFNAVGGFDTNLFLYYEESDLCRRILKQRGKKTYLIPDLEYIHYKGASTRKDIRIKIEQKIALMYHTNKHYGWAAYKTLLIYFCIRYFFSSFIKPSYWKVFATLLAGAPLHYSLKQKQPINEKN